MKWKKGLVAEKASTIWNSKSRGPSIYSSSGPQDAFSPISLKGGSIFYYMKLIDFSTKSLFHLIGHWSVGMASVMKADKHDWPELQSHEGFCSSMAAYSVEHMWLSRFRGMKLKKSWSRNQGVGAGPLFISQRPMPHNHIVGKPWILSHKLRQMQFFRT